MRLIRIAGVLAPLDKASREVIFPDDLSRHPKQFQLDRLAKLPADLRSLAIEVVADGRTWPEALERAAEELARREEPPSRKAEKAAGIEGRLRENCGDLYRQVRYKAKLKRDAALFLATLKYREKLREILEELSGPRFVVDGGPFAKQLRKICGIKDPSEWRLRESCAGTGGYGQSKGDCVLCDGVGYYLL